jgi:hypothetical protein
VEEDDAPVAPDVQDPPTWTPPPSPTPEPRPAPTPEQPVQAGFNVDFYAVEEGTERLSQITFDTPIHSMVVNSINERADDGSFWNGGPADFFAGRYTGVLTIREAGVYTFATLSDDGTILYVNGQSVVDNDGLHAEVLMQNEIYLEAGQHDIQLDYFEHNGGASVALGYGGPDTGGQMVIMDGTVVTPQPRPEPQPQPTPGPTPEQPAQAGFNVDFYAVEEGTERMSQISFDTPIHSMVVNSINENDDDGSFWDGGPADFFAGRYTGVLTIREAGVYTFATLSDDGTILYVNGQSVVDNDGLHAEVLMQNEIYLEAGQHDIQLDYFEHNGGASVALGYGGPDTGGQMVIMDGTVVTPQPRPEPQPQPQTNLAPVAAVTESAGETAQSASRIEQDEAAPEIELSGSQSSYTLRISDGSLVIEDRRPGGEGQRSVSAEDRLDFADAGIDLDLFDGMARLEGDAMAALTELYIAYFNRAPDAVGLYFWGNQLADGMSLREIAGYFFDQPETRALYGEVADLSDFVEAVYQNVLGRAPDASGLGFWLDLLEDNPEITPPTFIQEILAGAKAETGSPADAAYLANKVLLGGHFAVARGMSDVDEARMVMAQFDGSEASLAEGLAQSEAFYADALSAVDGDFLIQLVGFGGDTALF